LRREGDKAWTVYYVAPRNDRATKGHIDRTAKSFILWPWQIGEWSVAKMYHDGGFRIGAVAAVEEDGEMFAKMSFTLKQSKDDILIREGWILFNPKRRWSIRRCEVVLQSASGEQATVTISNEYRGKDDAILRRATMVLEHIGKPRGVRQSVDFVKYARRIIPESEFTVAAYGLKMVADSKLDRFGFVKPYYGEEPPTLQLTDARGVAKNVKLADFRGRWVLVYFWGANCLPCISRGLPALTRFHEEHAADRKRFEILAVCVGTEADGPKDIETFDRMMEPIIAKAWNGKALPFPVLIDGDANTFKAYNLLSVPSMVLIDPSGRVVKDGDESVLAERLKEMHP